MLVLLHPHGASSSEYVSALAVAPASTAAPKKSRILRSTSQQKLQSPMFPSSSLTFPLHQQQLHLQPREVLPVTVQAPAAGVAGSLYPCATAGVSGLPLCTPAVVKSSPEQAPLQQPYVPQLPAMVSSQFAGSACALPSATVLSSSNFSGLPVVATSLAPAVSLCIGYPQNSVQCFPALRGQQVQSATLTGEGELHPTSRRTAKEKQRLLHAKGGHEQHAWAEDLCEREDKYRSEFESTLEQQQEVRQQKERQQQPPLWRIPLVRDPLAAAAGDFNPIPVSEATLVRNLWKHARAAVEDPTSTPPFRWDPPPAEPPPSYWTDLQQHSRRLTNQQPVQHSQGRVTGEYEQENHHQNMHVQRGFQGEAQEESVEAGVQEAREGNSQPARRRRRSSTPSSRQRRKNGCEEQSEWPTGSRMETASQCHGEEDDTEQSAHVLSTRVGRSQSPSYICPRRDDFTAEQLIDAPAYNTNYLGLLSDTGMHYTKRYELPTLSRFLQAKHPVFLRARTSADERQQQSRPSSRDAVRARTPRSYAQRRQRGRQGDKDAQSGEKENRHIAAAGAISYLVPSISPVAASSAVLLQPQAYPQPEQNQVIVSATPAPAVTVPWSPPAGPVVFAQQHNSQVTPAGAEVLTTSADKSTPAPAATAASESSLMSAAVPLCVVPQLTTTSLPPAVQRSVACPGSLHYSLAEGASLATTAPATPLYAHAATTQQNLVQFGSQSTPTDCSANLLSRPAFHIPQAAILAMAPPVAPSSFDAVGPAFACVPSDAAAPGNAAATCASPPQHRADSSAPGIGNTVEQPGGTEMPGRSQEEAQRQTDKGAEDEKNLKYEIQPQQGQEQQHQEISEQVVSTKGPTSQKPAQLEQRDDTSRQQQSSQPFPHMHPPQQSGSNLQYSPQTYFVQHEPQGTTERENSTRGIGVHPTYFFGPAQSHLLVPPVAVAVPHAPPVYRTAALPRGEETLAVGEAKPSAVVFHAVSDAHGFPAVDRVGGTTIQLPGGSPVSAAASLPIPSVSSGTEVVHPVTFLPPGSGAVPTSATAVQMRAVAPPDGCSEQSSRQWQPSSYSVDAASPSTGLSPAVAPPTPAGAPTAHMLLQCQQWQPRISVPAVARSGQFVW